MVDPEPSPIRLARRANYVEPLNLAAYATLGLIAFEQLSALRGRPGTLAAVAIVLAGVLLAFLAREWLEGRGAPRAAVRSTVLAQFLLCLIDALLVRSTSGPIIGVIATAQMPGLFATRATVAVLVLFNLALASILHGGWEVPRPWFTVALYAGFQVFALLTAGLAVRAERARDELAQVNAHLLATRSLLEAGARDGERLRLSRELHDVAGHALTALKLNLELALRLPERERMPKVEAARALADQLLEDIRAVVTQLRQHDGVALEPALRALAVRMPGARLHLEIEPGLAVPGVAQAEALLRCVQEALTNAARHAQAGNVWIRVARDGAGVRVAIRDDGRGRDAWRPGNGLTGMRERLEEAGGRLAVETSPGQGFAITAWVPAMAGG